KQGREITPEKQLTGAIAMAPNVVNDPPAITEAPPETSGGGAVSTAPANAGKIPAPPVGKYFNFKIQSAEDGPIAARVHHVDFENGLEVGTYKGNTFVDLLRPGTSDRPMSMVCGVFGYKEIEKTINYANPSATDDEAFVDAQGVWVIPYNLERVETGDVSVMY